MAEPNRLPERVRRVIERVKAGERLCKSLRLKEDGGDTETVFFYEPSGKRAGPKSAQQAIESGHLKPAGDGLFDPSLSQTWTA